MIGNLKYGRVGDDIHVRLLVKIGVSAVATHASRESCPSLALKIQCSILGWCAQLFWPSTRPRLDSMDEANGILGIMIRQNRCPADCQSGAVVIRSKFEIVSSEVVGSIPDQTHSSCDREGDSLWQRMFPPGLWFPPTLHYKLHNIVYRANKIVGDRDHEVLGMGSFGEYLYGN
jgi:hypothetical protein